MERWNTAITVLAGLIWLIMLVGALVYVTY